MLLNETEFQRRITKSAEHYFSKHVCELIAGSDGGKRREWLCKSPGTGMYSFTVLIRPGWLMIFGDIGFFAFTREYDMLTWARQAVDDPYYMAGKLARGIEPREYSQELAEQEIRRIQAVHREAKDNGVSRKFDGKTDEEFDEYFQELFDALSDGQQGWYQAAGEIMGDGLCDDFCRAQDYTASFQYAVHGLRWWLKKLDAGEVVDKAVRPPMTANPDACPACGVAVSGMRRHNHGAGV